MLSVFTRLFSKVRPESHRERALSNEVDRLELQVAQLRREREALNIRLELTHQAYQQAPINHYPAHQWPDRFHQQQLFDGSLCDPIEHLLTELTVQGYDVSAPWVMHRALLDIIAQYQTATAGALASISTMRQISSRISH